MCRTTPKSRCAAPSQGLAATLAGQVRFTLPLDNGAQISVAVKPSTPPAAAPTIDFTGTSPQQTNNFNAPTAVCMAAVLYVFRTLVGR